MTDDDTDIQTELLITYAHQIKAERQRWLWSPEGRGVIPLGTGTIAAGAGGEGKSTFMIDIAAQLTRGELPGDLHGQKHPVIIFGPEDDWPTVMIPRLLAAGADLQRIIQVQAAMTIDLVTRERELRFPLDLGMLRQAVEETGARMVIIDPAPSLMNGDMNKVQDVRRSYEPLMSLAQTADLSIVLINHFGKGAGNVGQKLSGSHAWRDLTRSYLAFASDEETDERIITQDKNNYGTGRGSWKFILESVDVPLDAGGTAPVGKVRFLGESEVTVSDVINRSPDDDDEDDRNAAQAFILDFIKQHDAWEAKAGEVMKAGLAEGFSKDEIKKARSRCRNPKIVSEKSAFGSGWVWRIEPTEDEAQPEGATKVPKVPHSPYMAPSAPSGDDVAPSAGDDDDIHPGPSDIDPHTSLHSHTQGPMGTYANSAGIYEGSPDEDEGVTKVSKVSHTQSTTPSTPSAPKVTPSADVAELMNLDPVPRSTEDIRAATGWPVQRAGQAAQALAQSSAWTTGRVSADATA